MDHQSDTNLWNGYDIIKCVSVYKRRILTKILVSLNSMSDTIYKLNSYCSLKTVNVILKTYILLWKT